MSERKTNSETSADFGIHTGHRERMRSKFVRHGENVFETHELLEMLLYHIIPYKDTNPLAWRLIKAFSDLDGLALASKDELMTVEGVGERCAEFLNSVFRVWDEMDRDGLLFSGQSVMTKTSAKDFFVNYFATAAKRDADSYRTVAVFLDSNRRILSVSELYKLDFGSGAVRSSAFIDAAIEARATGVIIAHNHPFGPNRETDSDRATNAGVMRELGAVGITLLDHYLVCGDSCLSIMNTGFNFTLHQNDVYRMVRAGCICLSESDSLVGTKLEILQSISGLIMKPDAARTAAECLDQGFVRLCDVFYADMYILKRILGSEISAIFIKLLFSIYLRKKTSRFTFGKPHSKLEIGEYFTSLIGYEPIEKVYIMLFDAKRRPTACEFVTEGTVDTTNLPPRRLVELVKRGEACGAAIAHNHPSCDATPSVDDMESTNTIRALLESAGIEFFGHYVVSFDDFCIIYDRRKREYRSDIE